MTTPALTRAEATRQRLLEAALPEFSQYGYHGARVDRIAQEAGVNKQRIYAYFQDKSGLFTEVLSHCFTRIAEQEAALCDLPEAETARLPELLLRHYMAYHETEPHFWRILAWANLEGSELPCEPQRARQGIFTRLRSCYRQGQARGIFHQEVSFETLIFVLSSLAFFYYANRQTMSRTLGVNLSAPDVQELMVRESLLLISQGRGV